MADQIIPDDSISGNKIHSGVISEFQSTGIQDLATQTSLVVSNGMATVDKIRTKILDGNVSVNGNIMLAGSMSIAENVDFQRDLTIHGNLTAHTITVQKLIADVKQETREPVTFIGGLATDLNGKGLAWRADGANHSLLYKNGRLASTLELDIPANRSYLVGGFPVISATALGDVVVDSKLKTLGRLTGLTVDGGSEFNGRTKFNQNVDIEGSVTISGVLDIHTIRANQIITENSDSTTIGNFTANDEQGLDGQGIHFVAGGTDNMLVYRAGGKLWATTNFDLEAGKEYQIDSVPVLTQGALGPTVIKSNLRQVGTLTKLQVNGDVDLAYFAHFNSESGRVGLHTTSPNAALSLLDNNIEIVLGSGSVGKAKIGTFTNDGLDIVTDDTSRISIANNGEVTIGHPEYRNGVLRVNGKLYVDEVVADTRLLRSTSLQFQTIGEDTFYGKGIEWIDGTRPRGLKFLASPDRIFSTDNIDVADGHSYSVNGQMVLSKTALGETVTESHLNTVGVLRELNVAGNLSVKGTSKFGSLETERISAVSGSNYVVLSTTGINISNKFTVTRNGDDELVIDPSYISIGNNQNTTRSVRVFGKLGVGVSNTSDDVGLAVAGNLSFNNKKFVTGIAYPTEGTFRRGDICWNQNPLTASYIGWVCIVEGTPGEWKPFGLIA